MAGFILTRLGSLDDLGVGTAHEGPGGFSLLTILLVGMAGVLGCCGESFGTWKQKELKGGWGGVPKGWSCSDGWGRGGADSSAEGKGRRRAAFSANVTFAASSAHFTIATSSVAVLTAFTAESFREGVSLCMTTLSDVFLALTAARACLRLSILRR